MAIQGQIRIKESKRLIKESKLAERRGDLAEAKELIQASLRLDPFASQADWDLLQDGARVYRERRQIRDLVRFRLDDMAKAAKEYERDCEPTSDWKPKVFVFWAQGFDNAPPIVKAVHKELLRLHSPDELVVLDMSNVREWVTLPESIWQRAESDLTGFSDLLRLELLHIHGGIWADATCLPTERLQNSFGQLTEGSGFFAFQKNKTESISSWFLMARPGSYIVALMREAVHLYWRVFDKSVYYFYFHQIFRFLYRLDPRFNALWNKAVVPAVNPRAIHRSLTKEMDEVDKDKLLRASFVYKLTYKIKREDLPDNSVFEAVENGSFF
ncbi:capsular polysaccharide synthesis protein [Glutamicibacter creatinolyticus]|uniref:capsular polysaccharide synthesis protein n=1 Tax=Glutamicibacter creatinolyticus TaxID=162496 RepID=UPI0032166898